MTFLLDQDTPEDITYSLKALGHQVVHVRDALTQEAKDEEILTHAHQQEWVLITCNRDDFLNLVKHQRHSGIIILIRRKTRTAERAALVRLLDTAGESGIANNVNFA